MENKQDIKEKKEVIFREKIVGSVIISVGTTASGLGGTLFSLAAGFYLASKDFKVAILETKKSNSSLEFLNTSLKTTDGPNGSITVGDVDIYPYKEEGELFNILDDYKYIILDLGELLIKEKTNVNRIQIVKNQYFSEMLRAELSILVTSAAPWRLTDLDIYKNYLQRRWLILANLAPKDDYRELKNILNQNKVMSLPYLDPFDLKDEQANILSEILSPILPSDVSRKKNSGFLNIFKKLKS